MSYFTRLKYNLINIYFVETIDKKCKLIKIVTRYCNAVKSCIEDIMVKYIRQLVNRGER